MAFSKELAKAADAIKRAKGLIITSGSGLGVDSGLPDFRGDKGFWRAYPPLKKLNIDLPSMSNPRWFVTDPKFAWGFFGHRYNLYSCTKPHNGFHILLNWGRMKEHGYFVYTSNVDGHFQKAGFESDRICECHGSINHLQLVDVKKNQDIWKVPSTLKFDINEKSLYLKSDLPLGPPSEPNFLARPNILMFSDWNWISDRTDKQSQRYAEYCNELQRNNVEYAVIEIGSGLAVPTVRSASESLLTQNSVLIRINPKESAVPNPAKNVSLPMGALEALEELDQLIQL